MEASSSSKKRLKQTTLNKSSKRRKTDEDDENNKKRAGVITTMVLKNFMCHSLLEINFEHNASVVIGQNGSGKSAILTALVVGLGGKASLTNRGTNIKGFVKAGRNSATIEITLYNGGPMAYRPNTYGPSITVSRHFTLSGSSSYKIKNHAGDIISTHSREIENIATCLNIQVDNPICILNQDTSRNFLSSNNPKHKFTLFMKATKLETLASEYGKIMTNMRDSVRLLETKTNDYQKMREDIKKLQNKIDQHKSVRNLKEEEITLQTELLWAKVRDVEVEVQTEEEAVTKLSTKYDSVIENTTKRFDEIKQLQNSVREIERQVDELKGSIDVQSRPYKDAKNTLEKLTNLYQQKDREKQSLQNAIKSKNQDIQVLEQSIRNANENKNKVEQKIAERNRLIGDLEQKIKGNDDILQTARNEIFQIKSDVARKEEDDRNLRQEIHEIDQKINQYQERLKSLKNEKGNTLLLYGRHIPRVKQLIEEKKNKFGQIPRGPLGSYIKLKDKKWAVAAEGYIGPGLLNSFIVDNKNDTELLLQIFKTAGVDRVPTIITSKFFNKVHNVSDNLVHGPSDCVGLFEILEIDDPDVTNCIIDESSVEGILLIPSDQRAMALLSERSKVPKNCTQGVTVKGDRYFPDPNYKTYCSDYHQAQYLQEDTTEHIKHLEQKIQELQQQKQAVTNQYRQLKNEMNMQVVKQNELETKIRKLLSNRSEIRKQLDEIRSQPEPEVAYVEDLESELTDIKHALNEKSSELERLNNERKELKTAIEDTRVRTDQLKKGIRNLEERLPSLTEEIREKNIKIGELSTSSEFDNRKKSEIKARIQEHRVMLVSKQTSLQNHKGKAENVGPRPNDIRKVPEILEKLDNIERAIQQIQTASERVEDVVEQYKDLKNKFTDATVILEKLGENVSELKIAAKLRKKNYKITESYFLSYIKHSFKKVLEFRQFKGSLKIDVEAKTLELIVMPQQGTQGLTTTSNLSGGERSFSTVAFLYSLWQCMEFPFYFLDEFDVYMDKLNRTKVFDILMHHASTKPQLQFVFLTPQDISFLNKDVSVLRLEDPKRLND